MEKQDEVKVHIKNTKKAAKKPSIPHNRGRMMDFAPRRRTPAQRPAQRPASRPAQRPPQRPVQRPVAKPVETEPVYRPIPQPAPKPHVQRAPEPPEEAVEAVETIETATVATAVALPGYVEEREKEPTLSPEDIQRPEPVEPVAPASYRPVPPAHDPNSPFLSSVNVDKRPLSDQPATPAQMRPQHYSKNVYNHPQYEDKPSHLKHLEKTEVLPRQGRPKLKPSMIALIIATALLGVAIGILVYFAIFSQK